MSLRVFKALPGNVEKVCYSLVKLLILFTQGIHILAPFAGALLNYVEVHFNVLKIFYHLLRGKLALSPKHIAHHCACLLRVSAYCLELVGDLLNSIADVHLPGRQLACHFVGIYADASQAVLSARGHVAQSSRGLLDSLKTLLAKDARACLLDKRQHLLNAITGIF